MKQLITPILILLCSLRPQLKRLVLILGLRVSAIPVVVLCSGFPTCAHPLGLGVMMLVCWANQQIYSAKGSPYPPLPDLVSFSEKLVVMMLGWRLYCVPKLLLLLEPQAAQQWTQNKDLVVVFNGCFLPSWGWEIFLVTKNRGRNLLCAAKL